MAKWTFLPAALIALSLSSTSSAQIDDATVWANPAPTSFTYWNNGGGYAMDGKLSHGYPFHTGCCDHHRPGCAGLWAGYCGQRHHGLLGRGCGCHAPKLHLGHGCGGCKGCGRHLGRGLFGWRHHCGCEHQAKGCGCGSVKGKGGKGFMPSYNSGPMTDGPGVEPPPAPEVDTSAERRDWRRFFPVSF